MAERCYAKLSKVLNHEFTRAEADHPLRVALGLPCRPTRREVGGEGTGGVTDSLATGPSCRSPARTRTSSTSSPTRWRTSSSTTSGPAGAAGAGHRRRSWPSRRRSGSRRAWPSTCRIGPIDAETAMWLRDAALEGKLPTIEQMTMDPYTVLPLPLRPRALVLHRRSAGATRRSARSSRRRWPAASSRPSAAPSASRSSSSSDQWRDAVQKRYLPEIGARARARAGGRRAPDREALGGDAPPRPRALARRVAGRVLQREGLLLGRPVPGRRRHRQGEAPDPQVGHQQQLRDLPLHQLARRTGRRTGSSWPSPASAAPGTTSSSWTWSATRKSSGSRLQAERRHHAVLEPGRQAARVHRLRGRPQRPLRREPRRQRPAPAHRGQVRRPASGLVARRQDHRVRHRPRARAPTSGSSRSATCGSRSTTWPPGAVGCSTRWIRART